MTKKIKILGDTWTYRTLEVHAYVAENGTDSEATTNTQSKLIDFLDESIKFDTVVHELVHAFKSYLCLEDSETIDDHAYEEIYATFFGKYGLTILNLACTMYVEMTKNQLDKNIAEQILTSGAHIEGLKNLC